MDQLNKRVSFHVGSAITIGSDPMKEYEECMVKASALIKVLSEHGIGIQAKANV
jgi:para-aminobenzoate synthetase component 1